MTYEFYDYADQMKDFEKKRIKILQQERINVQKKTFTKWCNHFLSHYNMEINNLFKDLEDGKRLIKLLEVISGERLGKPNQGKLRVHKIENVNRAINFIQTKVKVESIGAEDIVDGKESLILGLIWTIILKFQISDIPTNDKSTSAKEALLIWCQRKIAGYQGVKITDFTSCWRNGLAFNALIHSQKPDLFDFNSLDQANNMYNLNHAFDVAQRHLGIPKLLDAEDLDPPDEKSILTYVSSCYHVFAKMKNEEVGGKRIGKIIGFLVEIDKMKEQYEHQVSELLNWIQKKIVELNDFVLPNSLDGIKALMLTFNKEYMNIEKPGKYELKGLLEVNFYNINMKLNAQGHPKYVPPEGKALHDLEHWWSQLEKSEHKRDIALKRELDRQERLEKKYALFDKKAKLREDWLSEMSKILAFSSLNFSSSQIDAAFRKHETIGADILARDERFRVLDQYANELISEDFFSKETVRKRNQQIQLTYQNLIEEFEKRKSTLVTFQELESLFQEMESLKNEMLELETCFQSKDCGDYLLAVEDLLTKHSLLESQIAGIKQHLKSVNRRAQQFVRTSSNSTSSTVSSNVANGLPPSSGSSVSSLSPTSTYSSPSSMSPNNSMSSSEPTTSKKMLGSESQLVRDKLDALNKAFDLINILGDERRKYLEERRDYHKFLEEIDEELLWVTEKIQIVRAYECGHDLNSSQLLLNKQEQVDDELKYRVTRIDKIVSTGDQMIGTERLDQSENAKITAKCSSLQKKFAELKEIAKTKRSVIEDSISSQQYFADANEAESWIKDKMALVSQPNSSYGHDEASTQAILQRHVHVVQEIKAYEPEINRLREITDVLIGTRRYSSYPADARQQLLKKAVQSSDTDELDDSENELPQNSTVDGSAEDFELVEELVDREVKEVYRQDVRVSCVKAMYAFENEYFSMKRGEVLELKDKSNAEWWFVENTHGVEGYAPANHLSEIGMKNFSKTFERIVKKPELVQVRKCLKKALNKKCSLRRKTTSVQPRQLQHLNTEVLQKRQADINYAFNQLLTVSLDKRKHLESMILFYKWLRTFEELSKWLKEKLQLINVNTESSLLENADSAKRLYQAFITDFLANQGEFPKLDALANDLIGRKTVFTVENLNISSENIKEKQSKLNQEWQKLLDLKKYWDNSIKAIQSIDQFNVMYSDLNDLLKEKLVMLQNADVCDASDVKSVRALQNKQDKLEREVGPIEKNIVELKKTGDEINKYFPHEKKNVQRKLEHMDQQWHQLRDEVKNRKAKLDEKHGLQTFENEVHDYKTSCAKVSQTLLELNEPHDLKQCEDMLAKYNEMENELNNEIAFKYNNLKQLSRTQLAKRGVIGSVEKVNALLNEAANEREKLVQAMDSKHKYLDDNLKLLRFKQDANSLELLMNNQEAYLQFDDLGSSSSNVDVLLKRHDEFTTKLNAQDEKMKHLIEQSNKLSLSKHFACQQVEQAIKVLVEKRAKLKADANQRKLKLKQSKEFFELKIKCDDLNSWINERRMQLNIHNQVQQQQQQQQQNVNVPHQYQIEKSLNKHEAIEKEINANRTRLDELRQSANTLIAQMRDVQKSEEIESSLRLVQETWSTLECESSRIATRLIETKQNADLNAFLKDIDSRVDNLENGLKLTSAKVNDLRSAKEALRKCNDLKKQMQMEADLIRELKNDDETQVFKVKNAHSVKSAIDEYMNKFAQLDPILDAQEKQLTFQVHIQQLFFDTDEELNWINQLIRQIELISANLPTTLSEAKVLHRKYVELERSIQNTHKSCVEKLMDKSKSLCNHQLLSEQNQADLSSKLAKLESNWTDLLKLCDNKKYILTKCLREQEELDELNQISMGLSEKVPIINNNAHLSSCQDELVINKHLAKLNQLEHDLKGYKDIMNKMEKSAIKLASNLVERKFTETQTQLYEMEHQIYDRKKMLVLQLDAIEFDHESKELLDWMHDKRQQAQSEDFGHDLEHLLIIEAKFASLKDEVKSSEPRFARLKKMCQELLASKSPESKQIRKRSDELKVIRELLDQDLVNREAVLASAAEIHTFNRDVHELLRRINEKEMGFVNELGRDFNQCESYARKHDIYIEQLAALHLQMNELLKQSQLLKEKHPGDTAESVAAEMSELVERFDQVWKLAEKRSVDLKQAMHYFKFIAMVKDVNEWMASTRRQLCAKLQFNDVYSVNQAKQELESLSYEMSQRDDLFKYLDDMCIQIQSQNKQQQLVDVAHPNQAEIVSHTNKAMRERENLFRLWKAKSETLDAQLDYQVFYREVAQLVSLINSHESLVLKAYNELKQHFDKCLPANCEQIESLIKAHQNIERKLKQSKLVELKKMGFELVEKESKRLANESNAVFGLNELHRLEKNISEILKRDTHVKEACALRTKQLNEALVYGQLSRDIDEFEMWIDERVRYARSLCLSNQKSKTFVNEIKLFQRQKALFAEIEANTSRFVDLYNKANELVSTSRTVKPVQIKHTIDQLCLKWKELQVEANERANEFEEAKDILEFNDELEQLHDWLKDKELMIQSGDTGHDYEHCVALIKKVDEVLLPSNEQRLHTLIQMSDKLMTRSDGTRDERDQVLDKRDHLLERYESVKSAICVYKSRLHVALEIHLFMRDYDDMQQRIRDKVKLLSVESDLRSVDAVQTAQSKLVTDLESDLIAIESKLTQLSEESQRIVRSDVDTFNNESTTYKRDTLRKKIEEIEHEWANLKSLLLAKKVTLSNELAYHQFMVDYRDLHAWIADVSNRMQQQSEPLSLSEAETALNLHSERRTEIDGKRHRFHSLQQKGNEFTQRICSQAANQEEELASSSQCVELANEVNKLLDEITQAQRDVELKCAQKQHFLHECFEYQELRESWKQLEAWCKHNEVSLRSTDVGDSVLTVKSLLTKHENIENSIRSQTASGASFDSIEKRAVEMIQRRKHTVVNTEQIRTLIAELKCKHDELLRLCANRRKDLEDSLKFQNFLLSYYETLHWMKEKTASAIDQSYLDLTNLQTKIQRNQIFFNDLKKMGAKRVDDLHREANTLLKCNFRTELTSETEEYLKDLDAEWAALKAACEKKRKNLDDAYKCVQLTRLCDDLVSWFEEAEAQLATDDNGHDLSSCKILLLRHDALTRQIQSQGERIRHFESILASNRDNFMLNKMEESVELVKQRFMDIQEPCAIRQENLDESLVLFTILHDLDDSLLWLQEKSQLASSQELGSSVEETNKLMKKHVQLDEEVNTQQPFLQGVFKSTRQLVQRKHYAHAQLAQNLAELESKWSTLRELIEKRSLKLKSHLEVQTYYADADDLIQLLKEKMPDLVSKDYGKDDLSSISYLKKLQAITNDLNNNQRIKCLELAQMAQRLQTRDLTERNVSRKQAELEQLLKSLLDASHEREQHLNAMLKIFEFDRECEANINWLKDQQVVAASQDFGNDLEHAEVLLKKFNEFMHELERNNERIRHMDEMAQHLCENKYTPNANIEQIDGKCSIINEMWRELSTLATVRKQTLEGAIEIHIFDKDCDDLIAWTSEKERFLTQEDIGYDLASVYTLAKQQESLESELTTLSEELERLNAESIRLCKQFPETKEHIETRLDDADSKYNELLKQLALRKEKIQHSQAMFIYANEFNELSEWLRDMLAKITSSELLGSNEVNNAELLIKRHGEYKVEIELQQQKMHKFKSKSSELLSQACKLDNKTNQNEIQSKTDAVQSAYKNLCDTWQSRQELYEHNLEYNKLSREIKYLNTWLSSKDGFVHTDMLGDSVSSVEALLKQHGDFENMLVVMQERFDQLRNETKLEKTLKELKQKEFENKKQADTQFEEEKKKDAERKRRLEKRRQDDRRRTQEIIAISVSTNSANNSSNNNMKLNQQVVENVESTVSPSSTSNRVSFNTEVETELYIKPVDMQIKLNDEPMSMNGATLNSSSFKSSTLKNKKDRNRTRSIRDKYKLPLRLPPPIINGYLMRKQEYQKGGQRAPIREYQSFYTTIHANLMCFFMNEADYNMLSASSNPINLFQCKLNRLEDTTIQRDVIHLETIDGAEYLFDPIGEENDEGNLELWFRKLSEASVIMAPITSTLSITSSSSFNSFPTLYNNQLVTNQYTTNINTEFDEHLASNGNMYESTANTMFSPSQTTTMPLYRNVTNQTIVENGTQIKSPLRKRTSIDLIAQTPANTDRAVVFNSQENVIIAEDDHQYVRTPIKSSSTYFNYTSSNNYTSTDTNTRLNTGIETFSQPEVNPIDTDTTDIAPYRFRYDILAAPTTPLIKQTASANASDKVGLLDSAKKPVSIIKKGNSLSSTTTPSNKEKENEYYRNGSADRRNFYENSNMLNKIDTQQPINDVIYDEEEDLNPYALGNMVGMDRRTQTLPANGKTENDKEEAKSKRNIFGSLFKKKKAKYDSKTVNSPKKEKK